MDTTEPKRYKIYGREARLHELQKMINRPDLLPDCAVDMAYTILLDAIMNA